MPKAPDLPNISQREEFSRTLWKARSGSSRSTSLTTPFIVPSVIEYLKTSKWSRSVSVVPGEAETFCASAAKETGAVVLSNDSDFTLLAEMQDGGVVGMLHSLSMSHSPNGEPSTIHLRCWRPNQVKTRLDTDDLLRVAFERSRDATASFATILQRSQTSNHKDGPEAIDFARFTNQFRSPNESTATTKTSLGPDLRGLDPRIAELICQLTEVNDDSPVFRAQDLWVTLPLLLEDPSKDASWSYGRDLRRLAYSLLFATHGRSPSTGQSPSVTESIRKGQRITQDIVEVIYPTKLADAIRNCIADLAFSPGSTNPHNSNATMPHDYILWALRNVLKQRTATGKNIMPSVSIRTYLGLVDPPTSTNPANKKAKPGHPDYEAEWRLLHLNANVQAALYSLRMLRQTCIFLKDDSRHMSYRNEFDNLLRLISFMPPIHDLFLDVKGVRTLMRQAPSSVVDRAFRDIFPEVGGSLRASTLPEVEKEGKSLPKMEEVVRKKRKKQQKDGANAVSNRASQPGPQTKFSTNPFDLLME